MGDFKVNFVSRGSPRGLQTDLLHQINEKWRIGAAVNWQDFYQNLGWRRFVMEDGSDLGAVQSRSLQSTVLMVKAQFQPLPDKKVQPYFTLAAGANLVQVREMLGQFDNLNESHIGFALQASAGYKLFVGERKRTALFAGAAYNYLPFNRYEIGNLNNVAFQAGVRLTLRNDGRGRSWDGGRPPRRYNSWGW